MALGKIIKGLSALAKTSAKGAGVGAVASSVSGALNNDEEKIAQTSANIQQNEEKQNEEKVASKSEVFATETPEAMKGFAAHLQKESEIAERVHRREQADRIYGGLRREDPVISLIKGLKSSAIVLHSRAEHAIADLKKKRLDAKREEEEAQIEEKPTLVGDAFRDMGRYIGRVKNGILVSLSRFIAPAALFGGAYIADQVSKMLPKDTTLEDIGNIISTVDERVAQLVSLGGLSKTASFAARVATLGTMPGVRAAQIIAGQTGRGAAAAKYGPLLSRIQGFFGRMDDFAKASNGFKNRLAGKIAAFPPAIKSIFQKAGKTIFKWFLIFEIGSALYRSAQAFTLGTISEAEWHAGNKEQISKLIQLFGAPILGMMILGFAGSVVPVLGNMTGAFAGFIIGVILGETLFYVLNMDALIKGIYDAMVLGNYETLKGYAPALISRLKDVVMKLLWEYSPFNLTLKAANATMNLISGANEDRIATEEEIISKYGEDISSSELIMKASEGMGTDENAILYAFKDIDTPEKYLGLKSNFEEKILPEVNRKRTRPYRTMEQYLRAEMSDNEYNQLRTQVTQQMVNNEVNQAEELNRFFREAGYDEINLIPGIENVSPEEYKKYQSGQLVDVVTKDGKKVLMSEEELKTSEEISPGIRQEAIQRAQNRGRMNQATNSNLIPTQNTPSSVVVVNNTSMSRGSSSRQDSGLTMPTTPSSAFPTRMTNDSFIDMEYVT